MAKKVSFTVWGQAPSKSNYRHFSKGWQRKWKRIKEFEKEVGKAALAAGAAKLAKKCSGQVCVDVLAYSQRCDGDNLMKSCLDGLEGVAFQNDKDVACSVRPLKDKSKARVEITITFS